ncbi:uncharacterized protein PAC_03593 [Phialocephala subalpina]|uniref:Uncharacterized protein n=1 Tax=Phialocephala subalpina TaxID=576137 RepID=A0A1L7WLR7_9HELO|nr:uncharacterized protein PAC_03593 [Phialocephala subalpina]
MSFLLSGSVRKVAHSFSISSFSSARTFITTSTRSGPAALRVYQNRLWDTIYHTAQWGAIPEGGVKRLTLTAEDNSVREWFRETTKKYGCTVKDDAMGNMFAVRPGQNNSLAPISIAGVEIFKVLHENKIDTFAPYAVVNWTNEEGLRFDIGMLGSGVWGGQVELQKAYDHQDADGKFFKDELQHIGFLGDVEESHKANPLSAHFELHIEQGPVLEDTKQAMITRANEIALEFGGLATVGVINSEPQSPGTVPGKTVLSIDLCHLDNPTLDKMFETAKQDFNKIAAESKVEVDVVEIWKSLGAKFHPD